MYSDKELIILLLNNDHEIIYKSGFIQNFIIIVLALVIFYLQKNWESRCAKYFRKQGADERGVSS